MRSSLASAVIVAFSVGGCTAEKTKPAEPRQRETKDPAPRPDEEPPTVDQVKVEWSTRELGTLGVRADFVTDGQVSESEVEGTRFAAQSNRTFSIGLHRGARADLDTWFASQNAAGTVSVQPPTAATLCGVSGQRQEASIGPHEGSGMRDGKYSGPTGRRRISIAVEVETAGERLLAYYIVDADRREAHAPIETHFFAAIECNSQ